MPITNVGQVERFTEMCGASIPKDLLHKIEAVEDDPEAVRHIGMYHSTQQCLELLEQGVAGIHFYTLNRSTAIVLEPPRPDGHSGLMTDAEEVFCFAQCRGRLSSGTTSWDIVFDSLCAIGLSITICAAGFKISCSMILLFYCH